MLLLANASSFMAFLLAAALAGIGSSIFHPEGSRAARAASGGRLGLAQSLFQLGGNSGSAAAPLLLAVLLFMPLGSLGVGLAALAFTAILLMAQVLLPGGCLKMITQKAFSDLQRPKVGCLVSSMPCPSIKTSTLVDSIKRLICRINVELPSLSVRLFHLNRK
nr:hypothetical protein [uncultured Pseudomonas sp.]